MKKLLLALILVVVLTVTLATPVFAGEPPDGKPMPEKSIQGLLWACVAMAQNYTSLLKPNPHFQFPASVKAWTNIGLIGWGPPIAWGYWVK